MSIEAIASAVPTIEHSAADLAEQTGADEAFVRASYTPCRWPKPSWRHRVLKTA